MAVTERMVRKAMPVLQRLRSGEDVRRARRIDLAIDNEGRVRTQASGFDSAWNGNRPLRLGTYHFWVDTSGRLRVKSGKATSDTDGTIVGTQS